MQMKSGGKPYCHHLIVNVWSNDRFEIIALQVLMDFQSFGNSEYDSQDNCKIISKLSERKMSFHSAKGQLTQCERSAFAQ